ncbi:natterin-3-like [Aphidius gifuensis]|uniref:natterin-3-like n=1 Tax=Aphidius gifuensis TaxID=684658 RepID=UPI001CDC3482|nr:natterin-3-like [Aphidius gifuensis]
MPAGYKWVKYSGRRNVEPEMIVIGHDLDGSALVIGRAYHHGEILPAKVKPQHGVAYVSYDGVEHTKYDFEIMFPTRFDWVSARDGHVPSEAVKGGQASNGETLYVGRTIHCGVPCVGKVHPSHGSLFIPYGGKEVRYREYEVLVMH